MNTELIDTLRGLHDPKQDTLGILDMLDGYGLTITDESLIEERVAELTGCDEED